MRVIVAAAGGGTEVLTFVDRPIPEPGPGELLVRVHATAINRADINQRKGVYALPPGSTDVLGLELAGEVVTVGDRVDPAAVGSRVCGLVPGGGHAEYAVLPASSAIPIPDALGFEQAAAIPEAFLTAYDNLVEHGGLAAGKTALVHGGSSGVGTAAIQIATLLGASVYVTCGSQDKIDACIRLGATAGINYRTEDFVDRIGELTGNHGVDVVLDHLAGDYLDRDVRACASGGRVIVIATMGGRLSQIDAANLMAKGVWLTGSRLRPRSAEYKAELTRRLTAQVLPAIESGTVRPVIDTVLAWEEIAQAHQRMESSGHVGKIVLRVASQDSADEKEQTR